MAIEFNSEKKLITLHTADTTYQMMIGRYGHLLHLYYGMRAKGDFDYLLTFYDRGFSGNPYESFYDKTYSMDALPQEFPCFGNGDYRTSAFHLKDSKGVYACDLRYKTYRVVEGKYSIPKLPAVYVDDPQDADTLIVTLVDEPTGVEVDLYYGVIYDKNVITRATVVRNCGQEEVYLSKCNSTSVDYLNGEFDIMHFYGRYGMERNLERNPLPVGTTSIGSCRGNSSHQHNPFVILADKKATESRSLCYGYSLLYSGDFRCEVERDQYFQTRLTMGILDEFLDYKLEPGESFYSPEAAMTCGIGFNSLSWNFHRLVRDNIIRGPHKYEPRPVLINNWEATYFDFDGEKLINIAKQAAELGVEMLVLDDGWFSTRFDDSHGLGDWEVNQEKLGMTIAEISKAVNDLGLKFGLWIEPEMVSEDTKLYKEHPDWTFMVPGRKPTVSRYQLVLDFSRKEVVDHILNAISKVIEENNVQYVKMDMNRSVADVYTATEGWQNRGTIMYKYVLGVYDFLERLLERFPHLLIEGCCGGGGRFDMGMLYYTPQIWVSDNTDAIERIRIQYGTSFAYPVSAQGAHVSASPNHQTGRTCNIVTRGIVAQNGTFGYELDLNTLPEEEKEIVKQQIKDYKKYQELIRFGRYYRLTNPNKQHEYAAWELVKEDQSEVLVSVVTLTNHCNNAVSYVYMRGLDQNAMYVDEATGIEYSGAALTFGGFPLPNVPDEYQAFQWHFLRK